MEIYVNPDGEGLVWGNTKDFQIGISAPQENGTFYTYSWFQRRKPVEEEVRAVSERTKDGYQIQAAIDMIKKNPRSRRIIVSAWNVADVDKMALPPCHAFFQFYVVNGRLDCQLYQRSADVALGVPFNIASYALLLSMIAQECQLTPGIFVHTLGDAHIYLNHVEGLKLQLQRTPKPLPRLKLAEKPFGQMTFEDIELINYSHDPFIKFPIAV